MLNLTTKYCIYNPLFSVFFTVKLQQNLFSDGLKSCFFPLGISEQRPWNGTVSSYIQPSFFPPQHNTGRLIPRVTHLNPTTIPGFMLSTQCHLYTTRQQLSNLFSFSVKTGCKIRTNETKRDIFFFTLFTIPIISSAVLYYTVKVNALLC